jgi:hypothetical protein
MSRPVPNAAAEKRICKIIAAKFILIALLLHGQLHSDVQAFLVVCHDRFFRCRRCDSYWRLFSVMSAILAAGFCRLKTSTSQVLHFSRLRKQSSSKYTAAHVCRSIESMSVFQVKAVKKKLIVSRSCVCSRCLLQQHLRFV